MMFNFSEWFLVEDAFAILEAVAKLCTDEEFCKKSYNKIFAQNLFKISKNMPDVHRQQAMQMITDNFDFFGTILGQANKYTKNSKAALELAQMTATDLITKTYTIDKYKSLDKSPLFTFVSLAQVSVRNNRLKQVRKEGAEKKYRSDLINTGRFASGPDAKQEEEEEYNVLQRAILDEIKGEIEISRPNSSQRLRANMLMDIALLKLGIMRGSQNLTNKEGFVGLDKIMAWLKDKYGANAPKRTSTFNLLEKLKTITVRAMSKIGRDDIVSMVR